MSASDPINSHQDSIYHAQQIRASKQCGCFYCLEIFPSSNIEDWTDNGTTAICPHCGIDSVIAETAERKIDKAFLQQMNKEWF